MSNRSNDTREDFDSPVQLEKIEVIGFTGVFLREAARSAARAETSEDAPQTAGATAAAVLLACAAIEAYLSEYATVARLPDPVLDEVRDGTDSLHTRFLGLCDALGLDRASWENAEVFKNLRCLVFLRNAIAHRKAAFLERGKWPSSLSTCKQRIPYHKPGEHHWTSVLLVADVAHWAVKQATAWLQWVDSELPSPD